MRLPHVLTRRPSLKSMSVTLAPGEFACAYYGWVMLPLPTDASGKPSPIEYNKLVEMSKRVALAQTSKARRKGQRTKPERAAATVSTEGITVQAKDSRVSTPLLHAAIDTVICMLVSKSNGVAVIVAHTWDGQGKAGIGCDVLKLAHRTKTSAAFTHAFERAVHASTTTIHRTASSPARVVQNSAAIPTSSANGWCAGSTSSVSTESSAWSDSISDWSANTSGENGDVSGSSTGCSGWSNTSSRTPLGPLTIGSNGRIALPSRRRSSAAANARVGGGYDAVESFLDDFSEENFPADAFDAKFAGAGASDDTASYISVLPPSSGDDDDDEYLTIGAAGRLSTHTSASSFLSNLLRAGTPCQSSPMLHRTPTLTSTPSATSCHRMGNALSASVSQSSLSRCIAAM